MRTAAINLRAMPEQRDLIDHAAALLGKNRSDFMLDVACEKARSIILDQTFFGLDSEKYKQFSELLDAPVSENIALANQLNGASRTFVVTDRLGEAYDFYALAAGAVSHKIGVLRSLPQLYSWLGNY